MLGSAGQLALLAVGPLQRHVPRPLPRLLDLHRDVQGLFVLDLAVRPELEVLEHLGLNLLGARDLVLAAHVLDDRVVSVFDGVFGSSPFQLARDQGPSAAVLVDQLKQLDVLLKRPVSLLN